MLVAFNLVPLDDINKTFISISAIAPLCAAHAADYEGTPHEYFIRALARFRGPGRLFRYFTELLALDGP